MLEVAAQNVTENITQPSMEFKSITIRIMRHVTAIPHSHPRHIQNQQSMSSHSAMPSTSSPQTTSNCAAAFPRSSEIFGDINANNHTHETIFLKTAKAVALSTEKKLTARIFFDEGSQRSYIRTAFASALNVVPTSYETLSVCCFGASMTGKSFGVTTIVLEVPTGDEYVSLLVTNEIVQPLD